MNHENDEQQLEMLWLRCEPGAPLPQAGQTVRQYGLAGPWEVTIKEVVKVQPKANGGAMVQVRGSRKRAEGQQEGKEGC